MRVVPHERFHKKVPKRRVTRKIKLLLSDRVFYISCAVLIVGFALAVVGLRYGKFRTAPLQPQAAPSEELRTTDQPYAGAKTNQRQFSGEAFRQLYERLAFPNTAHIQEELPITGNPVADERIRNAARSRGYSMQSIPERPLEEVDGFMLQEKAVEPWLSLKTAAGTDGIGLEILSAFRSPDDQRRLFLEYTTSIGISAGDIARGAVDNALQSVLSRVAVPGYSKHHNGYTIDIKCTSDESVRFGDSNCFKWLSANNYEQPKKYGWIPSYPPGAGLQGPEPEPWEYIWVGSEVLYEQ